MRLIESYMGGGVRQVCPTRGTAGDGSWPSLVPVFSRQVGKKRVNIFQVHNFNVDFRIDSFGNCHGFAGKTPSLINCKCFFSYCAKLFYELT